MKILLLTTVMAPYRVELFNRLGKEHELYVMFERKKDMSRDDKWYLGEGFSFRTLHLKKWDKSLKHLKIEVLKWLIKIKPECVVIYEYSTITAMFLMSCCRLFKVPYCINCDGGFATHHAIKDLVKMWYIKGASAYIAGGKCAEDYFLAYGAKRERIVQIHFSSLDEKDILKEPVCDQKKSIIRDELHIPEKKVILSIGRFIYGKGFDVLLRACEGLDESVGVYIIGGKATEEYLEMVRELDLKNIHFLEFMKNEELLKYYMSADIFVLPTRWDAWGLVINEAMACGLPVITTDKCVAGLELIEDGINGYIVPAEDKEELKMKIDELLENKKSGKYMGVNNLEKIQSYTYEYMARQHEKVFTLL